MFEQTNLLTFVTAAVLVHLTWRLLRNYVTRSPFSNIAGPPSGSLWAGEPSWHPEHLLIRR